MVEKKNWLPILEPIMRNAGAILMKYFRNGLTRSYKKEHGFFTEADLASEKYLIEQLSALLPDAAIIAEESGNKDGGDYAWVIDPLDGTTNFVHGLPYFCVSVALTYKNDPIVGAIFQPIHDEFFYAQRNCGALLNNNSINVSESSDFGKSLIALGLPYDRQKRVPLLKAANKLSTKAYGIRHFGAAALDLAYVSCGRFDGCFFSHLAWWDVAAGLLLVQEAGGIVTDFGGNPIDPDYVSCMGAGKIVHNTLKNIVQS